MGMYPPEGLPIPADHEWADHHRAAEALFLEGWQAGGSDGGEKNRKTILTSLFLCAMLGVCSVPRPSDSGGGRTRALGSSQHGGGKEAGEVAARTRTAGGGKRSRATGTAGPAGV